MHCSVSCTEGYAWQKSCKVREEQRSHKILGAHRQEVVIGSRLPMSRQPCSLFLLLFFLLFVLIFIVVVVVIVIIFRL